MERQVVVAGLGRFGASVATTLHQRGHQVLAIDKDEGIVQDIASQVTHAVQADITNEAALRELGIANFDVAVVGVGSDIQVSLLTTVLLQRMGVPFVIARAENELHGLTLSKIGAHKVVYPNREGGERLAHSLALPDVVDYLEVSANFGISKITPPAGTVGKTLEEADLGIRSKFGLTVVLIRRGDDVILTPDRFERIQEGDILIVAGRDQQLEKLEEPGQRESKLIARP